MVVNNRSSDAIIPMHRSSLYDEDIWDSPPIVLGQRHCPACNPYAGLSPYLVDPITLFSPKTEQEPDAEPWRARCRTRSHMQNTILPTFLSHFWFGGQLVGPQSANWWVSLGICCCPGHPLRVWCCARVQKLIFLGTPKSQSCSASAPP